MMFRTLGSGRGQINVGLEWETEYPLQIPGKSGKRLDYVVQVRQRYSRTALEKLVNLRDVDQLTLHRIVFRRNCLVRILQRDGRIPKTQRRDDAIDFIQRKQRTEIVRVGAFDDERLFFPIVFPKHLLA